MVSLAQAADRKEKERALKKKREDDRSHMKEEERMKLDEVIHNMLTIIFCLELIFN